MLEILTFTGVDTQTDLGELLAVASDYPLVEFAILVGTETGQDNRIFPPLNVVDQLRSQSAHLRTAVHLCGRYARAVMSGRPAADEALAVSHGFGRVQVNLHGDWFDPAQIPVSSPAVTEFADALQIAGEAHSVILQHRGTWDSTPVHHPRVEYLFDLSEGAGIESFSSWPEPPASGRAGYAGGIGPHNIAQAMDFIHRYHNSPMWLDMESQVRDSSYHLDLRKVRSLCEAVFGRR